MDVSNFTDADVNCLEAKGGRGFAVVKPQNYTEAGRFHSQRRCARILRRRDTTVTRSRPLTSIFICLDGGMVWLLSSRVLRTARWRLGLGPDAVNYMFNCLCDANNFNCFVLISAGDEPLPARGADRTTQIPREDDGGGALISF